MQAKRFTALIISIVLLACVGSYHAYAQTYSFGLDQEVVNVFWNDDGTLAIDYTFVFSNDPSASPLDYVDVGLPNESYDMQSVHADVAGNPVTNIEKSSYVSPGVAVGLGQYAIPPGKTGSVHVSIGVVSHVLRPDSKDSSYASAVFSPTWFGSENVHGGTDLTVSFHLPPGVLPEEPRWHEAPPGWSQTPTTSLDNQGRVTYTWKNPNANGSTQYIFGASFPQKYVPPSAIIRPSFFETLGISLSALVGYSVCCGFGLFFLLIIFLGIRNSQQRKLQYLPPKISIEGHGIKRGLTAIEAAILLEQPLDKIMMMILFSVIKKSAAKVVTQTPLKLDISQPLPESLNTYETKFLEAFQKNQVVEQRRTLQDMTIDLVKSVSEKMKGFSRRETIDYYKNIVDQAWSQVEAANTPEVKSQKFDEVLEWTMMDKEYDDRTRRVFREGPVFVPIWWSHYDPTFHPATTAPTISPRVPSGAPGGVALPHLPGSDFAASMVHGVQNFSAGVIGNLTDFTSKVTDKTNPLPVAPPSSKGSFHSGGGCACACACAGCACACAGGGR